MAQLTHQQLRAAFLEYFEKEGHRIVSSYSLIPPEDPTLLFVNAGMVQFKDVFTGMKKVPYSRATTSQKCLRVSGKHNDLENVGRTARHHTFFEMLGNFSFGDYFKKDAIRFAWDLLTNVLELPAEKMWVSVHPDDDEAFEIWRDEVGVPEDRIVRDPENFWSMGETGACGPCSEIYIDQGPVIPEWVDCTMGDDSDRFLELWNLVFMQYERKEDGSLTPLPKPSIDTGMGLERILAVLQGKISNYDTDLFRPLIAVVEEKTGRAYGSDEDFDLACRVLADHARTGAFLVADGVYPENEGRGYVLRRVLRRAIRFARTIDLEGASISAVAERVVDIMGEAYPQLLEHQAVIQRVLTQEEERFSRTLTEGERLLDRTLADLSKQGVKVMPGGVAFTLYDTHGFPLDLTELILRDKGFSVDRAGFDAALEKQRNRSRAGQHFVASARDEALDEFRESAMVCDFQGYSQEKVQGRIVGLLHERAAVEALEPGMDAEVLLDQTAFYAESGGQVGDCGVLRGDDGLLFEVRDTQKYGDLIRHIGKLRSDSRTMKLHEHISAEVHGETRTATRANHSATHLMHLALREVLGDHVRQRGSLVDQGRLRFDFSHFGPVKPEEWDALEKRVNQLILANDEVGTELLPFDEAVSSGALAFFDEKYGDKVRVVRMGPSIELCGGTHVFRTGDIGFFAIVGESSVSSGVRRIEAKTGFGVLEHFQEIRNASSSAAQILNTKPGALPEKVATLLRSRRDLEKEMAKMRATQTEEASQVEILGEVDGIQVQGMHLKGADRKALLPVLDEARAKLKRGLILVTNEQDGRGAVLLGVTDSLTGTHHAGDLLRSILSDVGGRGGGNAKTGQGGLDSMDMATIEKLRAGLLNLLKA